MQGKIGFEEHMGIPETVEATRAFAGESGKWDEFTHDILDLDARRLAYMDKAGIELAILSLNSPAVQAVLDTDEAIELARKGNDTMAAAVQRHPGRYHTKCRRGPMWCLSKLDTSYGQ